MNILEMKAAREEALTTMKDLNKIENRSLNADEQTKYNEAKAKVERLSREIETQEIENRSAQPPANPANKPKEKEGVSLRSLLNQARQNPTQSVELPIEERSMTMGTGSSTSPVVATETRTLIDELKEELIFGKLGVDVQHSDSLQAQPIIGSAVAEFLGENDDLTATDLELNKDMMSPKRLAVMFEVSDQLLTMDGAGLNAKLNQILVEAIARGIEKKVFSADAATTKTPAGILAFAQKIDEGDTPTYADIVGIETALNTANALDGNLSYVTNAIGIGALKTTNRTQNSFVLEGGKCNEYNTLRTNFLPVDLGTATDEYPVIFADFSKLQINHFGAIKIQLDPYTKMANNKVRFLAQVYIDIQPKYKKSFAYSTFKKA
jgi:HK97 family phage major capsid protein